MAAPRIYADENVNPTVPDGRRRRVDAWSAADAGNLGLSDAQQLTYAAQEHAVIFTHDTDLIVLAHNWLQQGQEHWGVIYVHQGHLSTGECIRRLKDYADSPGH